MDVLHILEFCFAYEVFISYFLDEYARLAASEAIGIKPSYYGTKGHNRWLTWDTFYEPLSRLTKKATKQYLRYGCVCKDIREWTLKSMKTYLPQRVFSNVVKLFSPNVKLSDFSSAKPAISGQECFNLAHLDSGLLWVETEEGKGFLFKADCFLVGDPRLQKISLKAIWSHKKGEKLNDKLFLSEIALLGEAIADYAFEHKKDCDYETWMSPADAKAICNDRIYVSRINKFRELTNGGNSDCIDYGLVLFAANARSALEKAITEVQNRYKLINAEENGNPYRRRQYSTKSKRKGN